MSLARPTSPLGRLAAAAIGLEILLGIGAIGGGIALMAGPHGEILPLPVSALTGSPFANYLAPGAILFTVLGLGPLSAAVLAWRRHPVAPFLALAVGGALLIWLVVEIAIVGYSNDPPLQALYFGLGVVILLVGVGWLRQRFQTYVNRAMRDLMAATPSRQVLPAVDDLPPPVARYRSLAAGSRSPVKTMLMRHGGTFRMKPGAKPLPIRGVQLFSSNPPGYVWSARARAAPGLWFDACDTDVSGEGRMRVMIDSSVCIVDEAGPEMDQGAALRLLAEMPWFPTALFDARYVQWSPIDASRARATLQLRHQRVSCVFEFGPDGLPVRATAERFRDKGDLRPWGGTYKDYRSVAGMRVPFEAEVSWQLDSGPYTYAHWLVDSLEYDVTAANLYPVGPGRCAVTNASR